MYFSGLDECIIGPGGLFTFFNWRLIFYSSVFQQHKHQHFAALENKFYFPLSVQHRVLGHAQCCYFWINTIFIISFVHVNPQFGNKLI